ncbi:hypothetical protein MHYP_G00113340 [Metynnis hypsauchen]
MQVSVEPVRLPQSVSGSSQCHGAFATAFGPKLEERPPEHQRTSSWRRPKPRHPAPAAMSSPRERDHSLKKKLLKEPSRYICSVPDQLTSNVDRGLSSDQSVSACSQSSVGGASPVSRLTSCSGSTGSATGFSTEHSSIYSWRYDEFDRANTQHVRQLFSALDELLYEGKLSSKSEALQKECEEWNTHSPHIRILGNQLEPPKQEGVQYVHRKATSARTAPSPSCLDKREDHSNLCVEGHRLAPGPWSVCSRLLLSELSLSHIQQEEEVYEAEGRIEEFLAYDGKETENEEVDQRKASAVASRDGVPPVSPKACIRDAVADELFDDVWQEVVGLLDELLHKHWEKQSSDGPAQRWTLESSSKISCETSSHLPSRGHHVSPSRGPNSRSMFLWANSSNAQESSVLKINLNGVMTIQAKPLQQRQQGFSERSLCDSDDGASSLTYVKTQGQRGTSALSHKPAVQRTLPRLNGRARLRHTLPAQSTQVLRGTRLHCVCHSEVFRPAAGEFKSEGSVGERMRRRKSPTNDAVFHIAAGRDRAGLDVQHISAFKGRGVFAVTGLARGEFVLEYRGDLISAEESRRRRRVYPGAMKGFMFDFLWHGKFWTIDAARDDGSLGRLVNDDHINPNCKMKRLIVEGRPHLCLFALRDITPGEELTYDYGDADCPWRSEVTKSGMEADNNHLESEGASGDDQHRTKPSQHKSAFGVQMTKNGMEAGSKRLESDGASGDDHHRTQHLQHESTFPNQVITTVMQEDGRHLKFDLTCGNAQQQRSAFLVQLDDACSISSVESSDDEYVPGSSDSSSDESACSRMISAMMDKDTERAEKARNFSDMYAARWGEFISSHALRTQREVKWNAPLVLPFTEDVKRLHLYLDQKQEEFFQKLSEDASSMNWTLLAKVTLAQTILFNRRREGEVSKMPLTSFASRSTDDLHEDVALALSELEKKLCHHFSRIEIRGKRGRKVPVLLTPTMQRNMELLKEKREECVVPSENIYMFARPAALSHLRGSDCLREFATECGAKNPKALSSTKLRKHIATLSNVLNLSNTELDQLADFLGHDVRVHRDYYRLPEGTLQLAKISKILMALETGRLGEFSGKNLDEIHIDPNEAVLVQSSDLSRDLSNTEDESDEGQYYSQIY